MEPERLSAVIDRARSGEAVAFSELYRHLRPRIMGFCRQMLGSTTAAEDASSEIFLRIQRALGDYDATRPFEPYALTIAKRYCIDCLRRENVEHRVFQPPDEAIEAADAVTPSPLDAVLLAERKTLLRDALRRLPDRSRRVLTLRYLCELSYDEIAEAVGLGRNHVAVLILRAKVELRQHVESVMKETSR